MTKLLTPALCALLAAGGAAGIDLNGLRSIGPVASLVKTDAAVTLTCADGSQVRITVLAPDLIRVRAAFLGKLADRDHSWAIEKTTWDVPRWSLADEPGALRIATDELEVVAQRSPLRIEFRDVKTHQAINADQQPMRFDPESGLVAAAKKLGFEEHFYGLGEKAARLDKRRGEFTMWNSDTFGYQEGTDPVYQSIPFYIGWQHGAAYGIFFDNSYRTHFDFGASAQEYAAFSAEGGEMNYYFFQGPSIKKILARYADLTGHMPMPPMWALGNQQSRYSYYPDSVAEEVVRKYRADDLPLDVLHLDIHFMNAYRPFTWDPQRFPNPKAFTDRLRAQGVKVVTIVDPGIKYQVPAQGAGAAGAGAAGAGDTAGAGGTASHPELAPQDQSYYVYNQGQSQNFYLKRKDGRTYIGRVWPGDAVFVDYTLDAAARWWGGLHRAYTDNGVAGIWNDMNEPSDFNDQTGKSQIDVVTYDGGTYSSYAKNRNVFALNENRATYQGLQRLLPNQRPYVITRAGYAGIQRYATMWAGDNRSTWEALSVSLPMFMTLGLSGEPFVGSDVGGFVGRTDAELLVRWYQVGFLTPFCRNHAGMESPDHEPWRYGKYYEDIIRKYLKLRYRLLPFLYTALEEAHRTGVPMFRPLLLDYQEDENTLGIDDEFTIAGDLLAAPILKPNLSARLVYLPAGVWFDYWTGARYEGGRMIRVEAPLETVPLFVRGGAILPLGPEMNYVGEKPSSPLFEIYPDARGEASTSLYEDDGLTEAYQQGSFRQTSLTYRHTPTGDQIDVSAPKGSFRP
ncbi:MAG TPA: glycoside hydrolase family 31 protein, partial [Candidatus Acidoferrales bacterium]|nr:glycoside hydrolase family 31 protein [Candidatus Acidoferrales bacterium]